YRRSAGVAGQGAGSTAGSRGAEVRSGAGLQGDPFLLLHGALHVPPAGWLRTGAGSRAGPAAGSIGPRDQARLRWGSTSLTLACMLRTALTVVSQSMQASVMETPYCSCDRSLLIG